MTRTTACGKPGCRRKADPSELHGPYTSWLLRSGGRRVIRKLATDQEARYQSWFDNDRRLRDLVTEVEDLIVGAFDQAEGPRDQRKSRAEYTRG